MADKAIPTLSGVPVEITDSIAGYLGDTDLAALHAVNKELYQKTRYTFSKRAKAQFADVHVFLHPVSLDKLKCLADDQFYATLIEHVTISTYVLRAKEERYKGSSKELWDQEESFICGGSAATAVTNALSKAQNLKSLTISDYWDDWHPEAPGSEAVVPWGFNKLNRLLSFKHHQAVSVSLDTPGDVRVWPMRTKAFEAALIGLGNAKLPACAKIGLVLNGNAPHPLSPQAHNILLDTLSSTTRFVAKLDTFSESTHDEATEWLSKINPDTLALNYDVLAGDAPKEVLHLHLGGYSRLTRLRITYARTNDEDLNSVLTANIKTLRKVELKHICLLWTDTSAYPWMVIFSTLAKMPELHHLWLDLLAAVKPGHSSRTINLNASQNSAWTGENISRALALLSDELTRFEKIAKTTGGVGGWKTWVDFDNVAEMMVEKYGIF